MPVTMALPSSGANYSRCTTGCTRPSAACIERKSKSLAIGLVNNMPDGALETTEQQFVSLLNAASQDFTVNLSFYSLPGISRSASAQKHIDEHYKSADSLWDTELDGLIVTGKEPVAANLSDEPFWNSFVNLLEWAREKTYSTIWSCLAAHAAVLCMDGIPRVRNSQKYSGIIDSTRTAEHPITANLPDHFKLPHSRWNGLPESELIRAGYEVMFRADGAGVDCFVKQEESLFLFIQSHPEYQLETLLLEYRRDVARFLRGETSIYPNVPQGYFDQPVSQELADLQREAATRPHEETMARLGLLLSTDGLENGWHTAGTILYRNWLQHISHEKRSRIQERHAEVLVPTDMRPQVLLDSALLVQR
jgi:homoserine O-succinyltransferase/O-acetyltransferase